MLKRFEVSNFRTFKDKLVFDLSKTRDYAFNSVCVSQGLVSKGIIYGKNGSGKSNFGLALFDITVHLSDNQKDPRLLNESGFLNLDSGLPLASFSYCFSSGTDEIVYSYKKYSPTGLKEESIDVNGKRVLFIDYSDLSSFKIDLKGIEHLDLQKMKATVLDNHISIVKYIYANTLSDASKAITEIVDFAKNMLWFRSLNEGNQYSGLTLGNENLESAIIAADAVPALETFLRENKVDLHLYAKDFLGQKRIFARFQYGELPLAYVASSGTISLLLFFYWKMKFRSVSLLFIDEFDAFYHYETSQIIVSILKGFPQMQSFVTTHNVSLMNNDTTRPDCCFIICDGQIKCLADCTDKEIRQGHNLEKMYRNGAFKE